MVRQALPKKFFKLFDFFIIETYLSINFKDILERLRNSVVDKTNI